MKEWYLKVTDGSIFGPAKTALLTEWASQGRILPGDQISENKEHWIPAEELPDLEMVWIVELKNGTYHGPVNIGTITVFLSEKTILPNAKLINRQTNEHTTVTECCPELVLTPNAKTDFSIAETKKLKEQISALNTELDSTRINLQNARSKIQERDALLKLEKERFIKSESKQSTQIDRLEREKKISADRIKKADTSIRELKQKQPDRVDWMGSKEPEKPKESTVLQIETAKREGELLHRIEALEADAHVAESKLAKRDKSLNAQIREYDNLKIRSKRKQTELEEDIKTLKSETADANKNISKLKSVLADERMRSEEFRKQIKTCEANLAEEQTKHKESRNNSQNKEADLAAQVDKYKTACAELAIQIRTIRKATQLAESEHEKAIKTLTEEKTELLHSIESLTAENKSLKNRLTAANEKNTEITASLESLRQQHKEMRQEYETEIEILQQNISESNNTLAEMKNKLESESVVPEILSPSLENKPDSNSHSQHLGNIEEQAQRELHKWQQQQEGKNEKSTTSIFSSWKKNPRKR